MTDSTQEKGKKQRARDGSGSGRSAASRSVMQQADITILTRAWRLCAEYSASGAQQQRRFVVLESVTAVLALLTTVFVSIDAQVRVSCALRASAIRAFAKLFLLHGACRAV